MTDLHIVIDTREQTPWAFPAWVKTSVSGISTGDYALKRDLIFIPGRETADAHFAIERKSADDFIGTISSGWHRFCKELKRMERLSFPAKIVVVETDYETFCYRTRNGEIIPPTHGHYRITPQFVKKQLAILALMQCQVIFAVDAELSAGYACEIFRERNDILDAVEKEEQKNAARCKN